MRVSVAVSVSTLLGERDHRPPQNFPVVGYLKVQITIKHQRRTFIIDICLRPCWIFQIKGKELHFFFSKSKSLEKQLSRAETHPSRPEAPPADCGHLARCLILASYAQILHGEVIGNVVLGTSVI